MAALEPAAVPAKKLAARSERRAKRRARRASRDGGDSYSCPRRAALARR
jgi:hypothetical protein